MFVVFSLNLSVADARTGTGHLQADPTGHTWSKPDTSTDLPNNNAGIEANIIVPSNRIVLAYNPQTSGRDPLAVALSDDGGHSWPHKRDLQHGTSDVDIDYSDVTKKNGNEFSYPSTLVTYDENGAATLHVTYTYNRETIKYKRFTEDWVIHGPAPSPAPAPAPTPSGKWSCSKAQDATGKTPGNFSMVGTLKDIDECQVCCLLSMQ